MVKVMRLTRKQVEGYCESVSMLTGLALFVSYRNGYVAIDVRFNETGGVNNLCCGSLRECYYFLKGLACSSYERK